MNKSDVLFQSFVEFQEISPSKFCCGSWGDFRCHFCGQAAYGTKSAICARALLMLLIPPQEMISCSLLCPLTANWSSFSISPLILRGNNHTRSSWGPKDDFHHVFFSVLKLQRHTQWRANGQRSRGCWPRSLLQALLTSSFGNSSPSALSYFLPVLIAWLAVIDIPLIDHQEVFK